MDLSALSNDQLTQLHKGMLGALASIPDDQLSKLYASMGGKPKVNVPADLTTSDANDEKVNSWLSSLPSGQREDARKAWASAYDTAARAEGRHGTLDSTIDRIAGAVPAVGDYLPRIEATARWLTGENYDNSKAVAEARQQRSNTEDTPLVASTPLGDIYQGGIQKAFGGLVGAAALPMANVARGAGVFPGAINTGLTAGAYGAIQGSAQGDNLSDRIGNAMDEGRNAAMLGVPLGGTVGAIASRYSPQAIANAPNTMRGQAIQAAEGLRNRYGQQELSEHVANADNLVLRAGGEALNSMPGGAPIRESAQRIIGDLGENVGNVAQDYARAGSGALVGAADSGAATEAAGQSVGDALRNWIGPTSRAESSANYKAAYDQLPQGVKIDTPNMRAALQAQMDKANAAGLDVGDDLFKTVGEALTRPQGMTIDGLKTLKSDLQSKANWSNIPEYTKIQDYVKPIAAAANADLRAGILQHGGQQAVDAFDQAAARHAQIANDREMLQKVVGQARAGDTSGAFSNARVVDNIRAMAMTGNRQNDQQLLRVRQAVSASNSPRAMNDFTSAIVSKMGEAPAGAAGAHGEMAWSPDRFATEFNKYTENGKNALFGARGSTYRDALENIKTISDRFKQLGPFKNPSGTAQHMQWFEVALIALEGHPLMAAGQVAATNLGARLLARPATARTVSRFGTALYDATTGVRGQAALRLATMNLAKAAADETGGNEREMDARLRRSYGI
jgi:hypothetical protein